MTGGQRDEFATLVRAGTLGSLAACALCTPLDVARHSAQASFAKRRPAIGFVEALRSASQLGVAGGLWRGVLPSLGHAALTPTLFLLAYEQQRVEKDALEAAACARIAATVLVQPVDLMRTCSQAGAGPGAAPHLERGMMQAIGSDGFRSLWRGLIPTLLRDVPASAAFWAAYAGLRRPVCGYSADEPPNATVGVRAAALGAGCAVAAAVATQPFDVVKTRMQVHQLVRSEKAGWRKVTIARVAAKFSETHAAVGVRGFWIGGCARALKAGVHGLLLGPLFEFCHIVAEDYDRPARNIFVLPEDPSRTIVHPRSTKAMFIEVKGAS